MALQVNSTLLLPTREQLCNRSCSNKHTPDSCVPRSAPDEPPHGCLAVILCLVPTGRLLLPSGTGVLTVLLSRLKSSGTSTRDTWCTRNGRAHGRRWSAKQKKRQRFTLITYELSHKHPLLLVSAPAQQSCSYQWAWAGWQDHTHPWARVRESKGGWAAAARVLRQNLNNAGVMCVRFPGAIVFGTRSTFFRSFYWTRITGTTAKADATIVSKEHPSRLCENEYQ